MSGVDHDGYLPDARIDVVFLYCSRDNGTCTTSWPAELLSKTVKIARVLPLGYSWSFTDFYPDLEHDERTIDVHSKALLQDLADLRDAKTADNPIIFVARDLGGLICANALSLHDANKHIIDNTCGLVFLETPFEGMVNAVWATVAEALPVLRGSTKPDDLEGRSQKLISINENFLQFLKYRRSPIKIECFYHKHPTRVPLPDLNPHKVSDNKFGNISDILTKWIIKELASPAEDENRVSVVSALQSF
ncbi:hypothetical protein H9L39_17593 [Fusarium oxysporum f. sp. albedinis]|nr:hypothetical protein H9L39_17593 [Fusarium oxysporum f. sp. albedinis]